MGAIGLGFMTRGPYKIGLTAVALVGGLVTLAYRAPRRRGYGPLVLALGAAVLILVAKFDSGSIRQMSAGAGLFLVAALWNKWPKSYLAASNSRFNNNLVQLTVLPKSGASHTAVVVVWLLACAGSANASGHGPVFGMTTPTNAKGGCSLDLGLMNRGGVQEIGSMFRSMLA